MLERMTLFFLDLQFQENNAYFFHKYHVQRSLYHVHFHIEMSSPYYHYFYISILFYNSLYYT